MKIKLARAPALLILVAFVLRSDVAVSGEMPMGATTASDTLLIVAPHPDDESLCCAGVSSRARRAGARAAIVWVSSGEGSRWNAMIVGRTRRPGIEGYRSLGLRRTLEARLAQTILGVDADLHYFVGYPDTGMLRLASAHFSSARKSTRGGSGVVFQADAMAPSRAYQGQNFGRAAARARSADFEPSSATTRKVAIVATPVPIPFLSSVCAPARSSTQLCLTPRLIYRDVQRMRASP